MPRPLEPVERAAFFSERTLAGLRACINQPAYCTLADNAPEINSIK